MKTIISKEALQTFLIDLVAVKSKMILNQEDLKIQLRNLSFSKVFTDIRKLVRNFSKTGRGSRTFKRNQKEYR